MEVRAAVLIPGCLPVVFVRSRSGYKFSCVNTLETSPRHEIACFRVIVSGDGVFPSLRHGQLLVGARSGDVLLLGFSACIHGVQFVMAAVFAGVDPHIPCIICVRSRPGDYFVLVQLAIIALLFKVFPSSSKGEGPSGGALVGQNAIHLTATQSGVHFRLVCYFVKYRHYLIFVRGRGIIAATGLRTALSETETNSHVPALSNSRRQFVANLVVSHFGIFESRVFGKREFLDGS